MTRVKSILYGSVATIALTGFAASAHAADMDFKAPVIGDLKVTFYGLFDVNGLCQDKGVQAPGNAVPAYFFPGVQIPNKSYCTIGSNGLGVSNVGFAVEKPIGYGWTAIARAETFFSPLTGEVLNGVGSIGRANSTVLGNAIGFGDSNSAGQLFNGDVYAGLSSQQFGTFTVGRLKSLSFDDFLLYDPQGQSLAFSMIGFYGGGAGTGDTQDRRWDNAAKWVWDGPMGLHLAAMGSTGCSDCGQQGAYGVDVGLRNVFGGFSVDATYSHTKDAVSNPGALLNNGAAGNVGFFPLPLVGLENQIIARISDNQEYGVMAKYVWTLPGWGSSGMYTKAAPTPATFTLYGGWLHIDLNDPSNPVSNGQSTIGGYIIGLANNFRYLTTSTQDWYWVGGKYATGPWTLTGAYYNQQRNSFLAGAGVETAAVNAGAGNFGTPTGVSVCAPATTTAAKQGAVLFATPSSNCAGVFQSASFVIDYAFNKNVDVYSGVNYNQGTGVFINSAQNFTSQITGTTGLRVRF